MASIPLPALSLRPVQQPESPISTYGQLMGIKNAQQELQQRQALAPLQQQEAQNQVASGNLDLQQKQQQVKDQQAMSATMQQWGKSPSAGQTSPGANPASPAKAPSYDDLVPLAIKNGASWNAVQGLQAHVLDMKAKASTIAMNDARAGASTAEALKTKNGMIVDAMTGVMNAPDDQLPQAIQQTAQELSQKGLFDPPHVQQAMQLAQLAQQNPAQARQQLDIQAKSLGGFSKLLEDEQKKYEVQKEAGASDPNSPFYAPSSAAIALGTAPMSGAIQQGEAKQAAQKAAAESAATEGSRVRVAAAEGAARANIEAQIARGSNAALSQVPPHLIGPATSAATKAGEDYAQAQSITQRMAEIVDAAKRGNVVSYQILPEEGALQVVTSQGVKRINMAEIQNYGGGNVAQKVQGIFGKAATGRSIPDSVLGDMSEIQSIMQRGSQSKYENSLNVINQTYGAKFKPVPTTSGSGQQASGGTPAQTQSSGTDPFAQFGGRAHQ